MKSVQPARLVVTGALGHIGSRLIRALPTQFPQAEIVMIDDLRTQRFASLFDLPKDARYRFFEWDVTTANLDEILNGATVVVHLAAITDAAGSFDIAEEIERVNLGATKRVSAACVRTGCALVHLSSTSVYGTQKDVVDENCGEEDLAPQSPYAATKLAEEAHIRALVANNGLRAVSLRFGTIFGTSPGMRFHTAVNKFCWQAVMGTPLTVWRTALDQKRPYLDLSDAVDAITHFIRSDLFDGGLYNVLTVNATVREIVDRIQKLIPDTQVDLVDSRIMNQLSYEVSCQRAAAAGFTAGGDINEGIKRTIDLLCTGNGVARRAALIDS